MSAFLEERVLSVHHWTDRLLSFTTTRDPALRFSNGHFTMIGLRVDGKPLLRAHSIVSAKYEEHLEFLSIKVPDGPLTSRLQHIQVGDTIVVGKKPTGTLLIDYLLPGKRLYLFGTGTGLAHFLSVVRDPETYEKFAEVVVVHGVREVAELAYHQLLSEDLAKDELLGEVVAGKLKYYPTLTREPFRNQGRMTDLIESGQLFTDLGAPSRARVPSRLKLGFVPPPGPRGDADLAFAQAHFKHIGEYHAGVEQHNPPEMFASTVIRSPDGHLTVYDKTQGSQNSRWVVSRAFGLSKDDVTVRNPFVGGAFGSGLRPQYSLLRIGFSNALLPPRNTPRRALGHEPKWLLRAAPAR